jgi:hypothetical protein
MKRRATGVPARARQNSVLSLTAIRLRVSIFSSALGNIPLPSGGICAEHGTCNGVLYQQLLARRLRIDKGWKPK